MKQENGSSRGVGRLGQHVMVSQIPTNIFKTMIDPLIIWSQALWSHVGVFQIGAI